VAPSLAQGKIGGCQSKHPAKGSGQVRSIGKSGAMSSGRDCGAINQVAGRPLQAEPKNIRPQGNAHRLSENVHEMRSRQAGYASQVLQRKIIRNPELLAEMLEHAIDPRMNLHGAAPIQQFCSHHRSTRASVGVLPKAARQCATWPSEIREMSPPRRSCKYRSLLLAWFSAWWQRGSYVTRG